MHYRNLSIFSFFFLVLLAASALPTLAQEKPKAKAAPVVAGEAVRGDMPILLSAIGTVEASEVVEIKARINGLLRAVHFVEGQDVRKGDLLFSLDSRDLEADLRSARAGLERVRAQLRKAEEDKRRNDELLRQDLISKDQQETTTTNQAALQAEVQAAEAAVESAAVALSYAEIRSPINGRTGAIQLHAGNMVKANADSSMVVITRVEPVNVRFTVPEAHLSAIMAAQAAGPLRVQAKPAGLDKSVFGDLSFIDSSVDAKTGTIALKARFANTDRQLWPGQFADVILKVGTVRDVVLVPDQAVSPGSEGEYVYIILPAGTVEYRPIKTGLRNEGMVVIESGLQGGEKVVLEGHLRLSPGAAVTVRPQAPAERPATQTGMEKGAGQ